MRTHQWEWEAASGEWGSMIQKGMCYPRGMGVRATGNVGDMAAKGPEMMDMRRGGKDRED